MDTSDYLEIRGVIKKMDIGVLACTLGARKEDGGGRRMM